MAKFFSNALWTALLWIFLSQPHLARAAADDNIPGVPHTASPMTGTLSATTDTDDLFQFTLSAGQELIASISGPVGSTFELYLFAPGSLDVTTASFIASAAQGAYPKKFSFIVPAGQDGLYYLDAFARGGSGTYTITYTIVTAAADDNVPGTALGVSPVVGTLNQSSDIDDVYSVQLNAGQILFASINGAANTTFDLFLYKPGSTDVNFDTAVAADSGTAYPFTLRYTVPGGGGGTYYLDTFCTSGSGTYTITYSIAAAGADDEIPGVALPATPVGGTLTSPSDYNDVYSFHLAAGQTFVASLSGAAGSDFDLYLFAPGSVDVDAGAILTSATRTTYPESITYTTTSTGAGTYYIAVTSSSGSGAYTLSYGLLGPNGQSGRNGKNAAQGWERYD